MLINFDLFTKDMINKNQFISLYSVISAFHIDNGLDSPSLVPMADCFTQSDDLISINIINAGLHQKEPFNPDYYRVQKYMHDYGPVFAKHGGDAKFKSHFNKKTFDANVDGFSHTSLYKNIKDGDIHIWESPVVFQIYEEDNDTDEDEEETKEQRQKSRIKRDIDFFVDHESQPPAPNSLDRAALEQKYNDMLNSLYFKGKNLKMAQLQIHDEIENNEDPDPTFDSMKVPFSNLNLLEYVPVKSDGEVKARQKQWLKNGEDPEDDEEFHWMEDLDHSDTYIAFSNNTRKSFLPGQAFTYNFFGDRTNMYLLVNHGICFENNKYDSLKLYLNLDLDKTEKVKTVKTQELLAQ